MQPKVLRLLNRIRKNEILSNSEKDIAMCYITWASQFNDTRLFKSCGTLNNMFWWHSTPQGYEFWYNISRAIDINYNEKV